MAINETTEPETTVTRERAIKRLKKRRDLYGHPGPCQWMIEAFRSPDAHRLR
jgi:hypothetical protein